MTHPAKGTHGGIRALGSLVKNSLVELYYAVAAVHLYYDTADEANTRKALLKLGKIVAKQGDDLAAEATETLKALEQPDADIPEPEAACQLLETQPAPPPDDIAAMDRFFRLKILKIPMDQEDAVIIVEGPLKHAFRTRSGLVSAK